MDRLEEFYSSRARLSTQLEKLITENSDLHLEWRVTEVAVDDSFMDSSYFSMKANPKKNKWIQQFVEDFNPIYEQLTLYLDYYQLRNASLHKDSYTAEEVKDMYKVLVKSGVELLKPQSERAEIIESLDPQALEEMNVSRNKLLYLAKNAPTTYELYTLLKDKMQKNPDLFPIHSIETSKELTDCYNNIEDILEKFLVQSPTEKDEQIVLLLTDMLVTFYEDLKDILNAMKGRRMMRR